MRFGLATLVVLLVASLGPAPAGAQEMATPGPCAVHTPPAVTIDGLKSRVVYGADEEFTLGWQEPFGVTVLDLRVMMSDRTSGDIFHEEFVDEDKGQAYFVRLDLGDGPADVELTYLERSEDGVTCKRTVTRAVRGFRRFELPARCVDGHYRPRTLIVFCGDGGGFTQGIRWRGWNRAVAIGTGTMQVNTCLPSCAESRRYERYRVRLRASRPRYCASDNAYRYTRLRVSFIGRKWPTGPAHFTQRTDCPPGDT